MLVNDDGNGGRKLSQYPDCLFAHSGAAIKKNKQANPNETLPEQSVCGRKCGHFS